MRQFILEKIQRELSIVLQEERCIDILHQLMNIVYKLINEQMKTSQKEDSFDIEEFISSMIYSACCIVLKLNKPNNVVILREKIIEKSLQLEAIEEFEKNILLESSWKVSLISNMEILILYIKFLYKNFKIHEINNESPNSISAYLYKISLYIFKMSILDFDIYSRFPTHIILVSSVFINLNKEGEYRALKKFQKEFQDEFEEIQSCIQMVEKLLKKVLRNNKEDEIKFENLTFATFFNSQN